MKINEVKELRVIRTEYIAMDGTVFADKEECKKYEESAQCVVKAKLKRLHERYLDENTVFQNGYDDTEVEFFDIQTEEDLDNLKMYAMLRIAPYVRDIHSDWVQKMYHDAFDKITIGHEVMLRWSYDYDSFYTTGDGSIQAYAEYLQKHIWDVLKPKEEKAE